MMEVYRLLNFLTALNGTNLTSPYANRSIIPRRRVPSAELLAIRKRFMNVMKLEYAMDGISFCAAYAAVIFLFTLRLNASVKLFLHRQFLLAYIAMVSVTFLEHDDVIFFIGENFKGFCLCFRIGALYFKWALFSCMLAEGAYISIKLVSVFNTSSKKKQCLIFGSVAWGLPLLILVLVISVWYEEVVEEKNCLMTTANNRWLFKGPVALLLMVNLVFFCYIVFVAVTKRRTQSDSNFAKTMGAVRAMLILYPLLGASFIFSFFVGYDRKYFAFSYIHVLLNGSQGVFFFIIHVTYDKTVRKALLSDVFGIKKRLPTYNMTKKASSIYHDPRRRIQDTPSPSRPHYNDDRSRSNTIETRFDDISSNSSSTK